MPIALACIAGEEMYRQWDAGRIAGQKVGSRSTPFGPSGEIFLIQHQDQSFYFLPRYGAGMGKPSPRRVPSRANLYALKDLGVQCILAWGPGGAITHSMAVGDLLVLNDVIDLTYLRDKTFFENSPLGFLRQFPVFCPTLRKVLGEVLHELKLVHHPATTVAVCEGPRLETPAEVRMLTTMGAEAVTHTFIPELFLAKELQMCYAGLCYVVNYAETGSRYRPFAAGDLFGGLTHKSDHDRLSGMMQSMSRISSAVASALAASPRICECPSSMARHVKEYNLPADWRQWFV